VNKYGPYQAHPAAELFPLIEGDEYDALVLDIKTHGLREPIVLNHDQTTLIDGRNRYRACVDAGVDPVFTRLGAHYTEAQLIDLVVSSNVHRRHLNPGQLSVVALRLEPLYAVAAKRAQRESGGNKILPRFSDQEKAVPADLREPGSACHCGSDVVGHMHPASSPERHARQSADRAAAVVGASGRGVQQAKTVTRDAPELIEQVMANKTSLDKAYRETRARTKSLPKPDPAPAGVGSVMLTLRTHDGKEVLYPKPHGKAQFNQTPGDGISWAAWSWNPVTGCLHGCKYCYAREIAAQERMRAAYPVGFTPLFHEERLDAPANTRIPDAHQADPDWRRVFVCSMADLYGRWVPDEWITAVHQSMVTSPQWEYLLLTKFPSRYVGLDLPPRAWVGTSVDEQKRVRIAEDAFRKISGVKYKWLSLEPLREPLEFTDLSMFDWIVIGAQTETRQPSGVESSFAPPFEWVARIWAQAKESGCKVHMKPNLLGRPDPGSPGMKLVNEYPWDQR
jgi:protein gp37